MKEQTLFKSLNDEEKRRLDNIKRPFSLARGQFLNKQHTTTDGLYYITSGFAKIIWPETNSRESVVKIVGPDDMTGYRCLFSEETFRASAISISSPLSGFFIPKDFFFDLIKSNIEFNFEILKRLGIEIRRSENRLRSYGKNNVRERVAESLIYLNSLCGVPIEGENSIALDIQLTRDEYSSWIGAAKETFVRCLSDMRDEGLIESNGPVIIIKNYQALEKIVPL